MGYNEFDELGDKIQDIIDSAINEKNYQKLSQSINQTLNKAIDNGSDALRDALNNTVGGGKYTNYRSGSSYDYRKNRSWDFRRMGMDRELVIRDMLARKERIRGMGIHRTLAPADKLLLDKIQIWHCIPRPMGLR